MKNNWFEMWFDDKQNIIATMYRNMADDIDAGYDVNGHSIRKQKVEIEEYQMAFDRQMEQFKYMDDVKVNRWCYYDMKKRGVIL